jgi:hypothetical protein
MDERFMVLLMEGSATTAPAVDVSRTEALRVTRELRDAGKHAYIMQLDSDCATCVFAADDPLPDE